MSEENVDGLLEQAEGKTKEEVKEIVAALRPKPAAEPMIRRKPAARSLESRERPSDGAAQPAPSERPFSRGEIESPKPVGSVEVASPGIYNFRFSAGIYNFRFSAGKEFRGKFERLAEVLGIEGAVRRMPEILEKVLDPARISHHPPATAPYVAPWTASEPPIRSSMCRSTYPVGSASLPCQDTTYGASRRCL